MNLRNTCKFLIEFVIELFINKSIKLLNNEITWDGFILEVRVFFENLVADESMVTVEAFTRKAIPSIEAEPVLAWVWVAEVHPRRAVTAGEARPAVTSVVKPLFVDPVRRQQGRVVESLVLAHASIETGARQDLHLKLHVHRRVAVVVDLNGEHFLIARQGVRDGCPSEHSVGRDLCVC